MQFNKYVKRFAIITIASSVFLLSGVSQTRAQTIEPARISTKNAPVTKKQREVIESIVHQYLMKNPSLIREALQALQVREEQQKLRRAAENLKALESDIYSDPDSPISGNPKGDIAVVVFFDYNCGYCKSTIPGLADLVAKDPSLRIIYKEFPVLGPQSQEAARAALAANRQGKYSAFHHGLITSDDTSSLAIKAISDKLGLNYATLQKDMADPGLIEALNRNLRLANALNINGTPAYIVGNQIIPGAIDMESLARIVSDERAKLADRKIAAKNVGAMK